MPPKKGKRRGDSDSDEEGISKGLALKATIAAANEDAAGKKKDKKEKKAAGKAAKGGGKGKGSDSDDDPLAIMKRLAAQAGDDSEDDAPAPPAPAPKRVAPPPAPAPAPKAKPAPAPAPEEEEEEEEEEEARDSAPAQKTHGKMSKADRKKQKAAQKSKVMVIAASSVLPAKDSDEEEEEEAEEEDEKPSTPAPAAAPAASVTAPAVVTPSAVAPATAAAPPAKEAPKTKLQLKLEKAKAEKAAADEAKRIADAAKAADEKAAKAVADAALKEQREKEAAEKAEKAAQKLAAEADDEEDEDEEEAAPVATPSKAQPNDNLTEEEREARLKATMFGDDVFDEHAKPNQDESGGGEGGDLSSKKLSRKELRKKAQEAEAKEREIEYNKAAMKASAEGAQFAVSQSIIDPNDPQWQNMLDVVIPSISISAHNKELFVNTELHIAHGRRYGLVGPNGAGKSTLLKMIAAGELKIPPRIDYLYVEQEVVADETPAVDAVLRADKVRWALVEEEKTILKTLEKGPNEALDVRLGEVYEQLANIGASSAEARARRILFGLGFDAEMQVRPTKYFSGGWRMRISLARALFIEPTLLMLDEPTNHLDLNAVIWLDDYLQKWKKTLLIVSHDQDFLNSVCQEVLHLDDKKLVTYKGNYDTFKELEAQKRKAQQKAWEKQEKRLRELKSKGVTKQNAEKKALEEKSKKREPGARSKKQEAAAVSSGGVESAESQIELIKRPRDYEVAFEFPEVVHLSPPILEVRDVNFRYGPSLPWLFRGVNFGLDMDSRVCIVGPNGSGKSTILKIITEELTPPEGEVRRNPRLRVGVYNQHFVDRLPMEEDPVTYLRRLHNEETYQSCRNMLGRYGLEGHAHTIPIRDLSGGQKARVVFVELSLQAPHLLFLDEPTNNLDIESIDALCDALKLFNGGVVLVSHDARLIETTNCQLWVVDEQNVIPWESGFTGYREHLLKKLEEQLAAIMPGAGERPGEKK